MFTHTHTPAKTRTPAHLTHTLELISDAVYSIKEWRWSCPLAPRYTLSNVATLARNLHTLE